ncbi:MAG: F0F1 ATP synthase subunit alpha, partial [Alloalcanivorax xenomutans]
LYAANEGYLKGIEVEKIGAFEAALLDYMNSEQKALMDKINEKGDYNDEIEAGIKEGVEQFKATQTW